LLGVGERSEHTESQGEEDSSQSAVFRSHLANTNSHSSVV
jgi:hypothetical protein